MKAITTDDELKAIEDAAYDLTAPDWGNAAQRRALYEAGYTAGVREAVDCQGLRDRVDWLLTKEAAEFVYRNPVQSFAEAMDLCRYLHDRITKEGQ